MFALDAGSYVALVVFFVGHVAVHARLALLTSRDASRRGVNGPLVAGLTFLLAPLGLALWAWVRQRPATEGTVDEGPEIALLLLVLTFLTVTAVAFGLTTA